MRKEITVTAEPRDSRGKNEARRLRARALAPAVIYGAGKDTVAVSINPAEINKILRSATGSNTIFKLSLTGGETTPVMIVDWQQHPLRENLLHVDLKRIDPNQRLKVRVPVVTAGDPKGVKEQGGLHEIVTRDVEIECLPDDIPERYVVDVANLLIGQNIRAGDIPLTGSVKLVTPADTVISHVVAIKIVEEAAPAEAAGATPAAAEPEVIKKGKKEEEGAAPAAGEKEKEKEKEKKK